jgi:hypothetical protein
VRVPEDVFQIINSTTDDPGSGALHGNFGIAVFGSTVPSLTMNAPLDSILLSAKNIGDVRATKLFYKSFGSYYTSKYTATFANVPVIRLAEMYLTRAECEAQTGTGNARADYNIVHTRAGLPPDNSTSGQALINAIRAERDMELAIEGDHFSEVKRRKGGFYTAGAGTLMWNDPTMIFPIPQQEVQENKAMVQNPGY